ncbi:MAG: type I methionyl aminopeptidase [Anaerovibrio sp.]|nr:type I methionyl aminopeptidase [Anaerovibrio sp.]
MNRNDLCWCGSGLKYKRCHLAYDERLEAMEFDFFKGQVRPPRNIIKNAADIEGIRQAGIINDAALDLAGSMVEAGRDTASIDDAVRQFIESKGAVPACLNYEGFPKSTCISLNDVVCHGIPSKKTIMKDGDILNIDITTILAGYYADASRMYIVGKAAPEAERLVEIARECMLLGIEAVKPWGYVGDIGAAVNAHAKANGCSVVTELGGHGVGKDFHEEPFIPHVGEKGTGMLLVPGMVFTVEPMINAGRYKVTVDKQDGWTVRTKDKSLSAQWEKTILVTENGIEVLSS